MKIITGRSPKFISHKYSNSSTYKSLYYYSTALNISMCGVYCFISDAVCMGTTVSITRQLQATSLTHSLNSLEFTKT